MVLEFHRGKVVRTVGLAEVKDGTRKSTAWKERGGGKDPRNPLYRQWGKVPQMGKRKSVGWNELKKGGIRKNGEKGSLPLKKNSRRFGYTVFEKFVRRV